MTYLLDHVTAVVSGVI